MSRLRLTGSGRHRRRGVAGGAADLVLAVAILAALGAVALCIEPEGTKQIEGVGRVHDGDTVTVSGERLRLRGIDAPELGQTCGGAGQAYPCGDRAREALRTLLSGPLRCETSGRDRYGRRLAVCLSGERDINAAMVAEGWAVAFGAYEREETAARAAGRGLWAAPFERPKAWRDAHGGLAEPGHEVWRRVIDRLFGWLGLA